MDGLSEVIANAAAEAHPEMAAEIPVAETPVVESTPAVADAPAAAATEPAAEAKSTEPDDIEAILEAEGIKPPVQGQRENRIPYSQTKRIIANAKKKYMAEQEAKGVSEVKSLKEWRDQHEPLLQRYINQDQIATQHPEQYVEQLARINPGYKPIWDAYQERKNGAKPQAQPQPQAADPEPGPDLKFADGSIGYSPEGLAKRDAWNRRMAATEAQQAIEKKYGPIYQQWQAEQTKRQLVPAMRNRVLEAYSVWGQEAVDKNAEDISKEMAANPHMSFENVVAKVINAKRTTDEAALREKWTKELQARPAAATRAPAVTSGTVKPSEPKTLEEVIAAAAKAKYGG